MQGIPRTSIGRVMRYWYSMPMSCLQHCQLLHILVRERFVNFPNLLRYYVIPNGAVNTCTSFQFVFKKPNYTRLLLWSVTERYKQSNEPIKTQTKREHFKHQKKCMSESRCMGYWSLKCEFKMAGYWPSSFVCLWTKIESRSISSQRKNKANIQTSWLNKLGQWRIITIGFWWNFSCGTRQVVPSEQHSSILPAQEANHSAGSGSSWKEEATIDIPVESFYSFSWDWTQSHIQMLDSHNLWLSGSKLNVACNGAYHGWIFSNAITVWWIRCCMVSCNIFVKIRTWIYLCNGCLVSFRVIAEVLL